MDGKILVGAIDVPDNAEWSLVDEKLLVKLGQSPKCIFRAQYVLHGIRQTSHFEPQEILHILNTKPE